MSRPGEISLKDAIDRLLNTYRLKGKLHETQLVQSWEKVMGRMIEKHTRDLYIKNRKLYVKLDSAVLRQELVYARTSVLEKVNQELGSHAVDEVIFL